MKNEGKIVVGNIELYSDNTWKYLENKCSIEQVQVEPKYITGSFYPGKGGYFLFETNGYRYFISSEIAYTEFLLWSTVQKENEGVRISQLNNICIVDFGRTYVGKINTVILSEDERNRAACHCNSLDVVLGGKTFNDYFLPSLYEMDKILGIKEAFNLNCPINERFDGFYWTSNELDSEHAWYMNFNVSGFRAVKKNGINIKARPIRRELI